MVALTLYKPGGATVTYVPAYDGNGNTTAYVDAGTAQVAATFEYAPFGAVLGVWYSSDTVKTDLATARSRRPLLSAPGGTASHAWFAEKRKKQK